MAYFKLAPRMGKIRRQCTPMTGEFALITPPNSSVGSESQRVRSGELTLCGESLNSVSFRSRDGRGIADSALALPPKITKISINLPSRPCVLWITAWSYYNPCFVGADSGNASYDDRHIPRLPTQLSAHPLHLELELPDGKASNSNTNINSNAPLVWYGMLSPFTSTQASRFWNPGNA